jgi:hypothetical protein
MSIIYEALQKTQKKRRAIMEAPRVAVVTKKPKLKTRVSNKIALIDVMIGFTIIVLILFISLSLTNKYRKNHQFKIARAAILKDQSNIKSMAANFKLNHKLNGVFISDKNSFALINNKSFHLGDMIDGMKIVDLNINYVKLENTQQQVILKT